MHCGESITVNSYSLDWLLIVNTPSDIVQRKGESVPLKEKVERGKGWSSSIRYDSLSMVFGNPNKGGGVCRGWLSWCGVVVLSQGE